MKIDIITRHAVANYGSILQTYATQEIIKKIGHEVEIINYIRNDENGRNIGKTMLKRSAFWNKNLFTRLFYTFFQILNYEKSFNKFKKFRKRMLKETKEYNSFNDLRKDIPQADIYCTGSDQVWGKIGDDEFDKSYFLEFLNKDKICISFSSSFGKDVIDESLNNKLPVLLQKYRTISVREDSAVNILRKLKIESKQVLDPVLLMRKENWNDFIGSKISFKNKKYILVYQLQNNKEFEKYCENFSKKLGMPIYRISISLIHFLKPGNLKYLPTPEEFIAYFRDAEYVITDSFHGTVFSIIFNKKFIDILPGKTSTRITSILKLTNLEGRILNNYNDFSLINKTIDFKFANNVIEEQLEISINLLKEAIQENNKTIDLLNKHYECCGCSACEQICPRNAISMIENMEGFLEPKIDYNKCINCGICLKTCPQKNNIKLEKILEDKKVYAAKNIDKNIQKQSSSGGIFSSIANYVLENNGVVFGANFNEKLELQHIKIENKEELNKLRGSKYIQSNLKNTFYEVKQELEKQKIVLYTGTPCQIAGIKSFLGKEYKNLYLVDLVCHGIPSQKIFKKYLLWLENKYNGKIIKYEFRNKEKNLIGGIKITFNNKNKFLDNNCDIYYNSFVNGKISRESCYNCKYANENRIGDITIADYWGIEKEHPDLFDENGVSAVIINTLQGNILFDNVKNKLLYLESNIDKVKRKNNNLVKPILRYIERDKVYIDIDNKAFDKFIKENLNYKIKAKDKLKSILPYSLKNKIKRFIRKKK